MTETPTPKPPKPHPTRSKPSNAAAENVARSTDDWPAMNAGANPDNDLRRLAPAASRNAAPILASLREVLPPEGTVLEIGSGTGQHAAAFATALAPLCWLPSDPDAEARASIAAWAAAAGPDGPLPPRAIDAAAEQWDVAPEDGIAAILAVNIIHIAPWNVTLGLLQGAARHLPPGGPLILYGPFARGGRHTAPSNAAFDMSLRSQNPAWGVRDLDTVTAEAEARRLSLDRAIEMPANNLIVVFRRR